MQLSSLIDEYRACEKALHGAIKSERVAAIREYDIRMNWLRNVIRDFAAATTRERMIQVGFFMESIAQASDISPHSVLFSDVKSVIERYLAEMPVPDAPALRETAGATLTRSAGLIHDPDACHDLIGMIERTDMRIATFDRDFRFTYVSPATSRVFDLPQRAFRGKHVTELIGKDRYEKRARAYFDKCLSGEDQCYYYYLDSEERGQRLLECRMLRQYDANNDALGALVVSRDLTDGFIDPLRSAEKNRI